MSVFSDKQLLVIVGAGVAVIGYAAYRARTDLNPMNPENVINRTVTGALGDGDRDLGQTKVNEALFPVFAFIDILNPFVSKARKEFARDILTGEAEP